MNAATFYPIQDSLGNLRIRVRLEKINRAANTAAPTFPSLIRQRRGQDGDDEQADENAQSGADGGTDVEEYTFRWQEKLFSQREFGLYAFESNCENVIQKQYNIEIQRLRNSGGRPNRRLFSYVEGDGFVDIEEKMEQMTISGVSSSYLVEKMSTVRHRRIAPRPQGRTNAYQDPVAEMPTAEAVKRWHTLPQVAHTMRIMADLGPRDGADRDPKDEYVLCTIRVHNDGLLSVKPDFNNQTKTPYTVKSRFSEFQYVLEHVSSRLTYDDIDSQRKAELSLYEYRSASLRSQIGVEFDVPEDNVLKVFYLVELLSAKCFEYNELFVNYLIELPRGWYTSTEQNCLQGTTQTCRTTYANQENTAFFAYVFQLELCCQTHNYEFSGSKFTKWPQLYFEVLSCDSWKRCRTEGYGYTTLPMCPGSSDATVQTWRPVVGGHTAELRRFFIGGMAELDDLDYIRIPKAHAESKVSKYGFSTMSAGELNLRFYTAFQSRQFISKERQQMLQYGALLQKLGGGIGAQSSIVSVLEAFQRARQRMIAVRDNIYADQGLLPA